MNARMVRTLLAAALLAVQAATPALAQAGRPSAMLFRDVNVVSMERPQVDARRDVLVQDGRIARIGAAGSVQAPPEAQVVDGRGRYLMPGLAEMHAHLPAPPREAESYDVLLLYLAHGITTIRGMLGHPWHLELRERLARHEVLGPRLYTAGPSFNGQSAPTVERAVAMVREQKAAGYDFLKLHPGLSREVFDAIAREAGEAGISFEGHVSEDVGVHRALDARQRAIDHLDGYMQALGDPQCLERAGAIGIFGLAVAHCADPARIPELVEHTRAAGTWMVPTQILLEQWALPPGDAELKARPVMRYLSPQTVSRWRSALGNFVGANPPSREDAQRFLELRRELIRQMHRAGVPIALGSDAPQVFNAPGDSALEELHLYTQIGLSPFDALRTATVNPARFFGAADRFGAVREGLEADLLLVEANPLEDVRAVRRLAGVMARGRWVPRAELDERLEALARRVGSGAP